MKNNKLFVVLSIVIVLVFSGMLVSAQKKSKENEKKIESKDPINSSLVSSLKFRSIGPALLSGRVVDFAVHPDNHAEYYVATASGGLWKTTNAGTSWKPVCDNMGSFSFGCVSIDPIDHNIVWAGTGENNSQRSVAFGDGVYKSIDGGKSWKNMGLKKSEHIAKVTIHPKNHNVVYVAAQGPLWNAGGDRGLYRTKDGGSSWEKILDISENTGITDFLIDPTNCKIMYAASYQRRRHTWTLINGGPESAIYKSTDGGENWRKIKSGLPSAEMGRIGLAMAASNPNIVYALIESTGNNGGVFRSENKGESWKKVNGMKTVSAQYYQELVVDPINENKLYSLDTRTKVSQDGGKTWSNLGNKNRHVDDHALWIDPENTDHLLIGGDGGIYETWDRGVLWNYKFNFPIMQFYRVAVDNDMPFYNVYGGTQDNNSLGGPSRTINSSGITNADWFVTNGGDGFESQIDPKNPNIVYAQAQYGWIVRYDKKSGEKISIKPVEGENEAPYRWNWDSPLLISPHKNTRLYFAANILFKSEDRGNSWTKVSDDLSRQLDRNQLKVFGKIQSPDAVAKNASTSLYGNIVALDESPLKEGSLYVGTDDGLIQVSNDGGQKWEKYDQFPGIPEMSYVSCISASLFEENTLFASFDNHKQGDFNPYILKSTDNGKSWTSIKGNLPDRHIVYSIKQDHINKDLLFVGTEFGVFFTIDGGQKWVRLKSGLPVISVKDLEIQRRENDLVLATFGRGFYILDDYSPLRNLNKDILDKEAHLFDIKDALLYVVATPYGGRGKSQQGEQFYSAKNPPVAAVFTLYLKDGVKSKKQLRKKAEKKAQKSGEDISYPYIDELEKEDIEKKSYLLFTIRDEEGRIVKKIKSGVKKGMQRVYWDMKYHSTAPASVHNYNTTSNRGSSWLVTPGTYNVGVEMYHDGKFTKLIDPQNFQVVSLNNLSLPAKDIAGLKVFQSDVNELRRAVMGTSRYLNDLDEKFKYIIVALENTPGEFNSLIVQTNQIQEKIRLLKIQMSGNPSISSRNENQPPSINSRLGNIAYGMMNTRSEPTTTMKESYQVITKQFESLMKDLKIIVEQDLPMLEEALEKAGAPYTPGRLPILNK